MGQVKYIVSEESIDIASISGTWRDEEKHWDKVEFGGMCHLSSYLWTSPPAKIVHTFPYLKIGLKSHFGYTVHYNFIVSTYPDGTVWLLHKNNGNISVRKLYRFNNALSMKLINFLIHFVMHSIGNGPWFKENDIWVCANLSSHSI